MAVSSRGYFTMAKELKTAQYAPRPRGDRDVSNTYPAYWAYPVEEVEFSPEKQFIDFKEIRGSRQAYTTLDGAFQPTAMIKGAVYPGAALAQILYGAFGDAEVIDTDRDASAGPPEITAEPLYTFISGGSYAADDTPTEFGTEMAFYDGSKLPTFTLERSDGRDGSATVVEQLSGCKIESLQFTANFGEKVDMTVNFQAAKKNIALPTAQARYGFTETGLNSTAGTPSGHLEANKIVYPGQEYGHQAVDITPLYFNRAAIKFGGQRYAYMKTLTWEMTNTLTRQETLAGTVGAGAFNITPTQDAYAIYEGGVECTLSGTAVFENMNLYGQMMSGEEFEVELYLGSDTILDRGNIASANDNSYNGLYFWWPRVKVSRASIPFTAGEVIESDVEFKVIFKPSVSLSSFDGSKTISASGSMFAKMLSRAGYKTVGTGANSKNRPWFYED